MQLMLKIPGAVGNALLLRQGQQAKVGRTEWADFCVPHDESLAEFHFALQCDCDAARLCDLQSGQPTWVNGQPVTAAILRSGDQIRAGETTFVVELNGAPQDYACCDTSSPVEATPAASPATDAKPGESDGPKSLPELCQMLELGEEACDLLGKENNPWNFINTLATHQLFGEALQLAAALLPAKQAVDWGSRMVVETVGPLAGKSKVAMDAAVAWAADPSEEHRRRCEDAAQASDFEGPASWIALGAFWSEGSMAPAGQPDVLPPLGLAAKAIAGALMLAATSDPLQANEHYRKYLTAAQSLNK